MSMPNTALDLVGKSLADFSVKTITEVYVTDDDGRKVEAVGYFFDPCVAQAWIDGETNRHHLKLVHTIILTDGSRTFLLNPNSLEIMGDEHAKLEIRNRVLAKLTPAERSVLGL